MRSWSLLVLFGLAACGGVPQDKYDAVVKERDELQKKLDEVQKKQDSIAERRKKMMERKRPTRTPPPPEKVEAWLKEANITRESKLKATIVTNQGDIVCDLWPDKSPMTVANFVGLAEGTKEWTDPKTKQKVKKPLYDGTTFHRIIKGFMIQGGDPLGNGTGGPGYKFEDEVENGLSFSEPGLLAMANAGPGTNGSQFFVMDGLAKWLNGKHTIFGKCATDVAGKIAKVDVQKPRNNPVEPVNIETIRIERL